jgi:3-oxoacyl-[acyl-carrier-protein] synthase II
MAGRSVVVTGIGLLTGLGTGAEQTWAGLVDGRSAIGPVASFDTSSLGTHQAAEIADFSAKDYVSKENRRQLRMMTRNDQLAIAGASLAMVDAGLELDAENAGRAGVFVGSNKEIVDPNHFRDAVLASREPDGTVDLVRFGKEAQNSVPPLFFVEGLQGASLFYISQQYGFKGANTYFTGTADVGLTAIGRAYRAIRRGESDVALAGGFDDPVNSWQMVKLESLGLMSTRNDLGAGACRPYDRDRDGTILGEGAALLVLEEKEHAVGRGARIYGEVVGFGSTFDTAGRLTPDPGGRSVTDAVAAALREADIGAADVGYVAAHGSGTRLGDPSEAQGLRGAFGNAAGGVAASSVKGATGHLIGGAGALNAAVAILAAHHRTMPPSLHLDQPDPACDFNWVTKTAQPLALDHTLALARGLAGQTVALAVRAGA